MRGSFRTSYASYMDSHQAKHLSRYIDELVQSGISYNGESRSGAIALYRCNKHRFTPNKPITKPNRTVYVLLCSPLKYESLIQRYETQDIAPTEDRHTKIWDLFLAAIDVRR